MARAAPYGYKYVAGDMVEDDEEQNVLTRIREMVQFDSYATVAGRLNSEQTFFRGKFWNASTVRNLVLKEGA